VHFLFNLFWDLNQRKKLVQNKD